MNGPRLVDPRFELKLQHLRVQVPVFPQNSNRPHIQWTTQDGCDQVIPLIHAAWTIYNGRDVPPDHVVVPADGDEYHLAVQNLHLMAAIKPYERNGFNYVQVPSASGGEAIEMRHDALVWSHRHEVQLPAGISIRHRDGNTLNDNPDNLEAIRETDGTTWNPTSRV